jgi:class 3 adenylate cyclase/predicted ATPase
VIAGFGGFLVEEWLSSIGLGERAVAFRAHGIGLDQLGELTDDDLRELGLTIGERMRFRRAVAALRKVSADDPPPSALPVLETTRAERRPLTIMFVDLVNSSSLGERLDPEDLLEVIRRYREFCGAAITRYGGHVARLIGDGILAYFCYPVATENDPERAVRAALDICHRIGGLITPAGETLDAHIGIATGQVIVSDLFAGGEDRRSIIGSTPNLAARLQSLAPSGGIVIADETHEHIAALFSCLDLGELEVRGFTQSHRAWRVLGEAPVSRANYERRPRRLTTFHDRVDESRVLAEHWRQARAGNGCTVVIIGEAGIGKSRLVQQFLATVADARTRIVHLAASAFDEDSPLRPVIVFLHSAAQLDPDAPREVRLARLASVLAGDAQQRHNSLPLFGELVGIAADDPAIHTMPPQILRERLLSSLVEQLLLWADVAPLCLVVEDLHWLDPTSLELLERMVVAADRRTIMLLLTARDGFDAPWMAERATLLPLGRLPTGAVADMVQSLFGSRSLPPHLADVIARRTDGVPLFVEAVTRSLLQLPSLPEIDDSPFASADPAIPASLRESLMARLDRSGAAKVIAQVAAVVGRSVRRDVLAAVANTTTAELDHALEALAEADVLLTDEQTEAGGRYRFSHALLRDAAYDSLLRDERRELHRSVADCLLRLDSETVSQHPEVLAHHLTEAGRAETAAPYWLEAARRSLARSALTEATRMLYRGLAPLERLTSTPENLGLRLQFSGLLGPAIIGLKGPGAAETRAVYLTACDICRALPDDPAHIPIYWGWWRVAEDCHAHLHRSRIILERATAHGNPEFMLQAHHCAWASQYNAGDFHRCGEHIDAGLALYEQGKYQHHAALYGNHDPKVCALGERAQLQWMQGRLQSALEDEARSIAWAERLGHLGSRVHAMDFSLLHRIYRREYSEVYERAGRLVTATSEHGLDDHRARGLIFRGWTVALQEDPQAGLATVREGLARQRDINTSEDFPIYVCLLAEALAVAGKPELAVDELARALREFERIGLHVWRSEVLRTYGEMILAAGSSDTDLAERLFAEAGRISAEQDTAMLGLRVAVSRARLYFRQDRLTVAERLLGAAIRRIAEHDGSVDLIAARGLLRELRDRLDLGRKIAGLAVH